MPILFYSKFYRKFIELSMYIYKIINFGHQKCFKTNLIFFIAQKNLEHI